MVVHDRLRGIARAYIDDWRVFIRQMRVVFGRGRTKPGLYTYHLQDNPGRGRLHLRVHDDGTSDMFVNVTQVIHLTPTATEIARMLLDGIPADRALELLKRWYPDAEEYVLDGDVSNIAEMIGGFENGEAGEALSSAAVGYTPLFATRANAPYKADIAVTYECNNNCAHCYNEPGRKTMPGLSAREWRQVIRCLHEIGVPHLIFTGGEPTTYDALPSLIRYASRLGHVTGVNTNGRRLCDEACVGALIQAGLDHIQITLASHRPAAHNAVVRADAYAQTIAGITNCVASGLHTITNTTLTTDNADHALDIIEFVHSLGVRTFAMNGMICAGLGRDNTKALTEAELAPLLENVRDRAAELGMRFLWYTPTEYCRLSPIELGLGTKSCNAAEYSICIEPNGDVLPCQSYYHAVGNVVEDDWDDIWNSPLFASIRNRRERPQQGGLPTRCWECPQLEVCGGGCLLRRAQIEETETKLPSDMAREAIASADYS